MGLQVDVQATTDDALARDALRLVLTVDTCVDPPYTLVELHEGGEVDRSVDPPALSAEGVTWLAAVAEGAGALAIGGLTHFPIAALYEPADAAWVRSWAFTVDLATVEPTEASGRIAFGIEHDDYFVEATRVFHAGVNARIAGQPGCPSACEDPDLADLVAVFDENLDGVITIEEVRDDSLVQTLLRPDLDLLVDHDGGTFWPGQDRIDDTSSFGIGFHASAVTLE